jgi:hypothetical protein
VEEPAPPDDGEHPKKKPRHSARPLEKVEHHRAQHSARDTQSQYNQATAKHKSTQEK